MAVETRADRIWNRVIAGFAAAVVVTLAVTGIVVLGGVGKRSYSQATPDDVIKSAVLMVKNGDARLLPDLVYAENEEMRGTLKRLGILLGHVQKLAGAIKEKFPADMERYKKEAEAALASGKPPAGLGGLGGLLEQYGKRNGPPSDDDEDAMRDLAARIFADPYAWIEENEDRLSTVEVTDDVASVMVDGKPAMGVGLTLKLDGDKWYLALPTNVPPVTKIMPKAPEQWKMINSLIKILDNTALELTEDVKGGRLHNLKMIGDKAQEKVVFPGAIWAAAYAADMDARGRIDRNLRQYRERQKAWAKARNEDAAGKKVSEKVLAVMNRVAAKEIGALVRARKAVRWGEMSDKDFEYAVGELLVKHKLAVDLSGTLTGETVEATVAAWERGAGSELMKNAPK